MKDNSHIISLDIGTMSMRAILYTLDGHQVFQTSHEYEATFRPPGLVEQNPSDWRLGVLTVLSGVGSYVTEHSLDVSCITITSQRASVIPVDASGFPLFPAVTWQDKRSAPQAEQLIADMGFDELYRITGLRPNPYFSLPKMMWFKQEEPDVYRHATKLLGVQDYVAFLLTGEFVTDWTQAARTMLLDISTFSWDDSIFEASGISRTKLPELVAPGSAITGGLRRSMARPVNLPEGLPVVVAGGDQQCAALALNVLSSGHAEANTGTGSFVIAHADEPSLHPEHKVLCSASAVPGKWINEAGIFNTGAVYRWFRGLLGGANVTSYADMNDWASTSPIGANGVVLLPHFEGSAAPNWNDMAKGVFFNLSIGTSKGDLCRAILEGIALEVAENVRIIERMTEPLQELTVAGGMASSRLFNQIQADATGLKVFHYANPEASSLGALMSALVSMGKARNFDEAYQQVSGSERIEIDPRPEAHRIYQTVLTRRHRLYESLDREGVYQEFSGALA